MSQPQTTQRLVQRLVQRFLHDQHTDTQTTLRATFVAIGRIQAMHLIDAA